ncbi:MAG: dihydroorotase family protein [Methanopyri archaeon]|jgi:dihydroorotase|nr:dihydroorotase family protein [Methanopyri archaeon]
MVSYDLAITGGRCLVDGCLVRADLYTRNGRIARIARQPLPADRAIDARDCILLPGLVDLHVHMRDGGLAHKETFATGSAACAQGGITTAVDMPNNDPPTNTIVALKERETAAARSSRIDFLINPALPFRGEPPPDVPAFGELFCYQHGTGALLDIPPPSESLLMFHAESEQTDEGERACLPDLLVDLRRRELANPVHLCHISTAAALDAVRANPGISCEVTPHHLLLTSRPEDPLYRVRPPLRGSSDVTALWHGVIDGTVTTIGSDHAPHSRAEKENGDPPCGIPGAPTMLPLLFTEFLRRQLPLARLARLTSENPARLLGLYPAKGILREGSFADVVVVRKEEGRIRSEDLYTMARSTPFDGHRTAGTVVATVRRGEVVYLHGHITSSGGGRNVKGLLKELQTNNA